MTIRAWLVLLLIAVRPGVAAADVDLTGRWISHYHLNAVGFEVFECYDFIQSGTLLTYTSCDVPPLGGGTGTIDPVTGAFAFGRYTDGLVAPDSNSYTAVSHDTICHFPAGCQTFDSPVDGARCGVGTFHPTCGLPGCGNGIVEPGEDCDEGLNNGSGGTCCSTACTFQPFGTLCYFDGSLASASSCDGTGACLPPLPCAPCERRDAPTYTCVPNVRMDCRRPAVPAGRVSLTPDAVTWSWDHGAATSLPEFGDPVTYASYRVCVFAGDGQGGTQIVAAADVPYGGTCGNKPCWRVDAASTSYRYRNNTSNGVRSIVLKSGGMSRAKIVVKGRGTGLGLPASLAGVQAPVTVQFERPDFPSCWASRFPTATASDASRFRARSGE